MISYTAADLRCGWLIKYKKLAGLIAGYNTSSKKKKASSSMEKLCRCAGNLVFIMAGVLAVTGAALVLSGYTMLAAYIGLGVFLVAALRGVIGLNTGRRLMKS